MTLNRFLHPFLARTRLLSSAAFGAFVAWCVPEALADSGATRALIGWNAFALVDLTLAIRMMWCAKQEHILANAVRQDDGRYTVLTLVMLASAAVLAAVGTQLSAVRAMHGLARDLHLALAALTVLSAWFFTQASFALHYAHDFFLARRDGEAETLCFPGTPDPRYFDFLYFACVIGTSAQTADVSFTSSASRAVGLGHCVQAFFFNTMVLALTINIAAGLF